MTVEAQIAELLSTVRIGGCVALAVLAATAGASFLSLRRLRRLEDRQARLEAWQAKHEEPLARLALEQQDPARAAALRNPQRAGSRAAPL